MIVIKTFPIISTILGLFLSVFILATKNTFGKNTKAKYTLLSVVLIYTLLSLNTYLDVSGYEVPLFISYLAFVSFHLIGILFFYFLSIITQKKVIKKGHLFFIGGYTVFKSIFFLYLLDKIGNQENLLKLFQNPNSLILRHAELDYMFACLINLFFIYQAYTLFKNTPLVLVLDRKKEIYYKWFNLLLITNIFIIILMMTMIILVVLDFSFLTTFLKLEPVIYTIYFFVLVYSLMYFPIFAFSGDYNDLPIQEQEKYKNSSLVNASELFEKIDTLVKKEQMFLTPELKLNALSERLDTSIPYISQAINETKKMSFSDYINSFRIEEAKKKLLVPKPDTIFAIAIDVGFNSKATFYYAFKKLTNTTPTEFRKQHLID